MAGENNKENTRPGVTSGNKKTFRNRKKSSGAGYDTTTNKPKLRREMKFRMHDASQKKTSVWENQHTIMVGDNKENVIPGNTTTCSKKNV